MPLTLMASSRARSSMVSCRAPLSSTARSFCFSILRFMSRTS